jgi:Flp pilus assembly pilin Flp
MDERGQALVEYGAVIALVAAGLVGGLALLGRATGNAYHKASAEISQGSGQYGDQGGSGPVALPSAPVAARPAEPPDSAPSEPDSAGQHMAAR